MHRFVVGTTLSSIFDLPEEKANLVFHPIRRPDAMVDQQVVARDDKITGAYASMAAEDFGITINPMPAEEFNAKPASETKWLVMLVKVEEVDGENRITDYAYFEARWAPNECETIRDMADRKGKPIEGFSVWLPLVMKEEPADAPVPDKVREMMQKAGLDPSRVERRLRQDPNDPHFVWLRDVACR